MTLHNLHSMFTDMADAVLDVHAFNDFNNEFSIYHGKYDDMPVENHDWLVRCFGTLDNGEIYIELEPGEENL